jgi:hypothetical protein
VAPAAVERPGAWHRSRNFDAKETVLAVALSGCIPGGSSVPYRKEGAMPSTIKITSVQRDALYRQVRNHLSGLSDVFTAMEEHHDFATAKRLGNEFSEDMWLLGDLGWHEDNGRSQVELTMPRDELAVLTKRLREEAKGGLADAIKESEASAGDKITEKYEATIRACEAVLVYLGSREGEPT